VGRADYVDVDAFEKAGVEFQAALLDLAEDLASLDPLPIDAAGAETVARELRELSRACRRMAYVPESMLNQVQVQGPLAKSRTTAFAIQRA
jgi:hypothetical protein